MSVTEIREYKISDRGSLYMFADAHSGGYHGKACIVTRSYEIFTMASGVDRGRFATLATLYFKISVCFERPAYVEPPL